MTSFAGLGDLLLQFAQQIAGALQIPLVRLLGQSPAGLNSTGESDLRTYYDNIKARQETSFRVPMTRVYRALAQSCGIKLPDGFWIQFRSLWQLAEKEKAEIAETDSRTITTLADRNIISQQGAMKEMKQSSHITGRGSNITQEDIDGADDHIPTAEEAMAQQTEQAQALAEAKGPAAGGEKKPGEKGAKE